MTNFIYNMQDELFHLNMVLPVGDFSIIKKLVDHIEAQGKQLRELNKTIEKKNKTIEKYEREIESFRRANSNLFNKVCELNEGIRDSEDLTWKQKYEALLQSSEQAICALQKKCQEYKNSESDAITSTIDTLVKENNEFKEKNKKLEKRRNELINQANELYDENKRLEAEKKIADDRWWEAEKELTSVKLANKYRKEKNEKLKKSVNSEYGVASRKKDYSISYLENRIKTLEEENNNLNNAAETLKKIIDIIHGKE